jgi:hypothetical protein
VVFPADVVDEEEVTTTVDGPVDHNVIKDAANDVLMFQKAILKEKPKA